MSKERQHDDHPETAPLGQGGDHRLAGPLRLRMVGLRRRGRQRQARLSEAVVRDISAKKSEPEWMLDIRLKALRTFEKKPMPSWGSNLEGIDFDNIKYFVRSTEKQATTWEELPEDIKRTYDRLGFRGREAAPGVRCGGAYECLAGDTLVWTANRGQIPIRRSSAVTGCRVRREG